MHKIKLLSQYDSGTLFAKIRQEVTREISQWPEVYFSANRIADCIEAITNSHYPNVPEIDFTKGEELMTEKVYPLTALQPGAKPGINVRVNVLVYQYPYKGEIYLLGCGPSVSVPGSPGICFADPENEVISIEYTGYEKSPRQVINAHRTYLSAITECYEMLRSEFEAFEKKLHHVIHEAVQMRKEDIENMQRILSVMQIPGSSVGGNRSSQV